jgi:hypothetical protein
MAKWFATDNPWTQQPDDARRAAIGRLLRAAQSAKQAAGQHATMRSDLTLFAERCTTIAQHWDKEPAHYRSHRRFAAVEAVDLERLCAALAQTPTTPDPATAAAIGQALARAEPVAAGARTPSAIGSALDSLGITPEPAPAAQPANGLLGKAWGGLGALAGNSKALATQVGRSSWDGASAGVDWAVSGVEETFHRTVTPARAIVGGLAHAFSGQSLAEAVWKMGGWGVVTAIVFPPAIPVMVGLSLMESVLSNVAEEGGRIEDAGNRAAQEAANNRQKAAQRLLEAAGLGGEGPQVFATPYVHTVVDAQSGTVAVRILEGRYTGHDLADIDATARAALIEHAPDTDTKAILHRWRA